MSDAWQLVHILTGRGKVVLEHLVKESTNLNLELYNKCGMTFDPSV